MAQTETPRAQQLETAQRLRSVLGKLSRVLRPTEVGMATDLTPTRVSVLIATDRHGPIRLAEVAEREGLNPTLLSRAVAHLVTTGLIERTPDPEDRRSAWLSVTPDGAEIAETIRRERTEAIQDAVATMTPEDRELLLGALPALEHLAARLSEDRP